ncbi:hypothetical protein GTH32_16765 [Alteromonas sp. 345S023]|uniref:PEP-CTERM sorting domain-containing protein n=1 Tax=Alteromonas profundi TaxID=2696062 RepID=A0A7X5LPV4_9ALTE|nr:hypothetical protein [Alteromonas profundi]NDV92824.1 hypothetical protein [Alteromonas profundi]
MKNTIKYLLLTGCFMLPTIASAGLVTNTFDSPDLSAWQTDRCAPDNVAVTGGELVLTIDAQSSCLTQIGFYHTQGIKLDIGEANFLSVDMYVDSAWTDQARFAGIWGVLYDSNDTISNYPILEFQLPDLTSAANGGFDVWDSVHGGWLDLLATVFNLDGWNTLSMSLMDGFVTYTVNGNVLARVADTDSAYIGEVILNAKNEEAGYTVRYDNLTYNTIPVSEPAMYMVLPLILAGLAARRKLTLQ